MKSITDSVYYFTTSDKDTKFGLLHPKQNKFYLVDHRYEVIKMVQFLLCKYQHFSVVNLLKINGGSQKIDNDKCHLIGCSNPAIKNFHVDVSTRRSNIKLIASATPAELFNVEMQEKIFFIRQFINLVLNMIEESKIEENSHIEDAINGLEEFKKFVAIVLPSDNVARDFVDVEIKIKNQNLLEIDQFYNNVIVILNQINFLRNDLSSIKSQISEELTNLYSNNQIVKFLKSRIVEKIKC